MKFYKINSNPLEAVSIRDVQAGELYVTSYGTRIKFLDDGSYIIDKQSPLNEGETLEEFKDPQKAITIFWNLMKNT